MDTIKEIRQENNLTQEAFGKELGYTRDAVAKWETGTNRPPVEALKAISEKFNCLMNDLLKWYYEIDLENKQSEEYALDI